MVNARAPSPQAEEVQVVLKVSVLCFSFLTNSCYLHFKGRIKSHLKKKKLFMNSRRKMSGKGVAKTRVNLMLPKALNLSLLIFWEKQCFASNNPCQSKWPCQITTGFLSDWRWKAKDCFLNPSSWASTELQRKFVHLYNTYLANSCHPSSIYNVSYPAY